MTDIEIAESFKPNKIKNVAKLLNLSGKSLKYYGDYIAKINKTPKPRENAKLVLVTAMTPTSAGIGKTTVSIGLADAMKKYVGPNPKILALPQAFKLSAVHLCMKDDDLSNV